MGLSINELIELPSLREASVIAGAKGMHRIINSITVLEKDDSKLFGNNKICKNEFFRSQLVITGFINSRKNVSKQLASIRKMDEDGIAGIILFYLGISIEKLDDKVIKLTDTLGLPLICLPENRIDLRYSDVICEVMEAIVRKQIADTYFASEVMERISFLNKSQRNMDSVLMMLRDRTRCSIYLTDSLGNILNCETWPRNSEFPFYQIFKKRNRAAGLEDKFTLRKFIINEKDYYVNLSSVTDESGVNLNLFVIKEINSISSDAYQQIDVCKQINEVIQTFINIWSVKHGAIDSAELIHAIIKDEPIKIRRIAEILKIDVTTLSTMWFFSRELDKQELSAIKKNLEVYSKNFVIENYDDHTIAMLSKTGEDDIDLAEQILNGCQEKENDFKIVVCTNLKNTHETKEAYNIIEAAFKYALIIFPLKKSITFPEVKLARNLSFIINEGENEILKSTKILDVLDKNDKGKELHHTLERFLLDGDSDFNKTAEIQYVHANTVKYRIKKIIKIYGYNVFRFPDVNELYNALALRRLTKNFKG